MKSLSLYGPMPPEEVALGLAKLFSEARYKEGILDKLAKEDPKVEEYIDWLKKNDNEVEWNVNSGKKAAKYYVGEYGFVRHSDVVLGPIIDFVGKDKVLEVGGGTGFMAHLLGLTGVDVVCTDAHPQEGRVKKLGAMDAMGIYHDRPVLLASWLTNDRLNILALGGRFYGSQKFEDAGRSLLETFQGSKIISISSLDECAIRKIVVCNAEQRMEDCAQADG